MVGNYVCCQYLDGIFFDYRELIENKGNQRQGLEKTTVLLNRNRIFMKKLY